MIRLKEAVIVEGRYDKIKLSALIDAPIIETNGFRIFKDKEKQSLIRQIAEKRGILIITDSDSAGFVIRNFLKGIVKESDIKQCYIPQLRGKEKRKEKPSKEGFLGVEGLDDEDILRAVRNSSATIIGENTAKSAEITKADFYDLGLTGRENSKGNREKVLNFLNIPTYLSTNAMITSLNTLVTLEELKDIVKNLQGNKMK
ncbi:MAG: DUF4093 domain-containing protein [Oscillospiraceae bacterium]|nr:DUF4093 domain-containing protein [Oscillospiraceae bacterium]